MSSELEALGWGDLAEVEEGYARAARAESTLRGYRSDWREFSQWCELRGHATLPAPDVAIAGYLTTLASAGAKVGTMSRRLSAIRFAHKLADHPDPTTQARVIAVWEGIRRVHAAPPDQARPLMPPDLYLAVDACPQQVRWKSRDPEPALAGARDRALLLVGFVSALRASELALLTAAQITPHDRGLVITLTRSKSNQHGAVETVILPRSARTDRCPVTALNTWLAQAQISAGPVFRPVSKGNRVLDRALSADGLSRLITQAVARAGLDSVGISAHSLRAGFVTYASLRGASPAQIARQTRHKDLATVAIYRRVQDAWDDNAATLIT